jgi:hypothetical protein
MKKCLLPVYVCLSIQFKLNRISLLNFRCQPGVDVIIKFFCDFWQFSAKNGIFLKNQCNDQIFAKFPFVLCPNFCKISLCFVSKTPFFQSFLPKIFQNYNIGPWVTLSKGSAELVYGIQCDQMGRKLAIFGKTIILHFCNMDYNFIAFGVISIILNILVENA